MRTTSAGRPFWELDPAVVCGLVRELGEQARAAPVERAWERDIATWHAVRHALDQARDGARPVQPTVEPPRWLTRLVREQLDSLSRRWPGWNGSFGTIRALERLGLVDLPADDTYVLAAVGGLADRSAPHEAATLREDAGLREKVVWRLFEVEGGGEVSLANVDKYRAEQNSWRQAFLELVADGTLPRDGVLTCALAALDRDFSAYRAGWFQRLYAALAPTAQEDAARQPELRALVGAHVPVTVGFAVARLRTLSAAGLLDDEATVPALEPALLVPVKGTAVGAVRLLGEIGQRAPGLRDALVGVAGTGLGHPHADVQRAAADLLVRLGAPDVVRAAAADLAPAVRAAVVPDVPGAADDPSDDVLPPVTHVPDLVPAGPHDVVERLGALLEDAGDPIELELVLAAVAALDDPAVLQPLRARAGRLLARGPHEMAHPAWLRGHLAAAVLAVLGDPAPTLPSRRYTDRFLVRRLDEVVLAARAGSRQPMLATPDSPAGWLSPETLVRRLHELRTAPGPRDVVAALLRVHPEERATALHRLTARPPSLAAELLHPLRYALGAPPDGRVEEDTAPWWVAASRSRAPLEHDAWLAGQGLPGAGRSAPLDAGLSHSSTTRTFEDHSGRRERVTTWRWELTVADGVRGTDRFPTAARGRAGQEEFGGMEETVGWLALTWPNDAEHFLLDGASTVVEAAVQHEVRHDAVRVLDALHAHPGRMGALAGVTLAAGLSAARADQRARAVDLAVQLAATGRLTGARFGEALAGFAGPATPSRWARSLADLAATSRSGRQLVLDALPTALAAMEPTRRGVHELLELLRGELLREESATPPVLTPWLSRFTGSSRAATTARALLTQR